VTDFQNFFTAAFCEKFVVKWLLNIPPHLSRYTTAIATLQDLNKSLQLNFFGPS